MPALPTYGSGSGLWPTPTLQDAKGRDRHNQRDGSVRLSLLGEARIWPTPVANEGRNRHLLESAVMKWPTPTASDATGGRAYSKPPSREGGFLLKEITPGALNPVFVEWLMGFPLGWTDLRPLAMRRFRQWWRSHGGF